MIFTAVIVSFAMGWRGVDGGVVGWCADDSKPAIIDGRLVRSVGVSYRIGEYE